jgi:hypothetical protein
MEEDPNIEKQKTSSPAPAGGNMTLQKAVDFGEYDPKFLSNFPEWHTLSKHIRFQYIKQALDNRRKQLLTQWAELNNVLNFRTKPEIHQALKNVESQLNILENDREKLYVEYSTT